MPDNPVLEPYAVKVPIALKLLGCCRSRLYELIGEGKVSALKDGKSLLVIVPSIRAYQHALPAAVIKPPALRKRNAPRASAP
jgi:hypothetical protein